MIFSPSMILPKGNWEALGLLKRHPLATGHRLGYKNHSWDVKKPPQNDLHKIDQKYMRPEELENLKGDCSKAKKILGWEHEYTFETMLDEMIEYWDEYYSRMN